MKRYTRMLLSAALSLMVSGQVLAAEKLRIGTEGAFPPFTMLNAAGQAVGFDLDIAQALCAKLNAECEIVLFDWDGMIPALNAGKFDILAASMSVTEERKQAIGFTDHYYTNKLQFVAPKATDFPTTKASLKGKVIGAQRATIAGNWLEDNLGKDIEIKLYDTQENAYLDLASGRIDAMLADKFVQWEWLSSEAGKNFEFKGDPVFEDDKVAMGVRKNDNALRERLNKALAEIRADGTYAKLNAKYFPFSIY